MPDATIHVDAPEGTVANLAAYVMQTHGDADVETEYRCAAETDDGDRCGNTVAGLGERCGTHADDEGG